jgi:hypothetical protein
MFVGPPRVVTSYLGFLLVAVQLAEGEATPRPER